LCSPISTSTVCLCFLPAQFKSILQRSKILPRRVWTTRLWRNGGEWL
jgi:hypothetical protein